MKAKILILGLLLVPFVSGAETIEYIKTDKETIDDVRVKIAEQYDVDPDSLWIWDLENDPNKLFIDLPAKQETETEDSVAQDDTSEEDDSEPTVVLKEENELLKEKIALLQQLIALLQTMLSLKQ